MIIYNYIYIYIYICIYIRICPLVSSNMAGKSPRNGGFILGKSPIDGKIPELNGGCKRKITYKW